LFKKNLNILFLCNLALIIFACADEPQNKKDNQESQFQHTNKLFKETSPYLLEHAHNPVNWQAWSSEAFEEAKSKNQLVVISIGYSSCHWCHVMEEETFENEEVAKLMNENFVSIKVDREERPDIDEVYMTAINLIKGNGGWPLNVIALPNGKPIYTGTYHTSKEWKEVLSKISKSYGEDPKRAQEYANMIAEGIKESNFISFEEDYQKLEKNILENYVNKWALNWDVQLGGDKVQQKFMLPSTYSFLMDYGLLQVDKKALKHVQNSLLKMSNGGVYDHVGGGFFRYSTDEKWAIPHYEKMLYDNAQLLGLYSKAYRAFKDEEYKEVVQGIANFLKTTMKSQSGGFYAAIDADSDGDEGAYYTWTKEEINSVLGSEYEDFSKYFTIYSENSQEDKNVIFKSVPDSVFLQRNSMTSEDLVHKKQIWKGKLLHKRNDREHPAIDDKIIISWNALLISGFVEAYKAFGEEEYLNMAQSTFKFIESKGFHDGNLIHSYKKGGRRINGFLDDYAYFISALNDLYSVTHDTKYLNISKELVTKVNKNFSSDTSVQYQYSENDELISPILKIDDGVLPSPNSIMAENLFFLGHIYYNEDWLNKSEEMVESIQIAVKENPSAYAKWNHLYLKHSFNFLEIAIIGKEANEVYKSFTKDYYPNSLTVASVEESEIPLFEERYISGETYIYVCENRSCKRPVTTVEAAKNLINDIR